MLIAYDLEDNPVKSFDTYKECAEWFNTSAKVIQCYVCRSKKGKIDKKYNKIDHNWYRLFKIEDD